MNDPSERMIRLKCKSGHSQLTWHDFQTCFDTKKECLPAIETSVISSLDIALAASRKNSFDFLDESRKR